MGGIICFVSLAVRTPGVTHSKFFVSRPNGWHHPFKILVSHSNGWDHPFEIFHKPFEQLASSIRNYLLAVQTAGIIHSKFFLSCLNGWYHLFKMFVCRSNAWRDPFEIFYVPFERLASSIRNFFNPVEHSQHPFENFTWLFERYLNLFQTAGTSVSHPFVIRLPAVRFDRQTDIP